MEINNYISLDEEQLGELEQLAALGYSPEKMAVYFKKDKAMFVQAALDVNSNIHYHIERGKLMSVAKEQMAMLEGAEGGDVKKSQQLAEIRRSKGWQMSKMDIFGGGIDKKLLRKLEDYIQGGSVNDLKNEEKIYLEALTLFNSMSRKYGRRNTVKFFTREPFNLQHRRASEMYDEAVTLFYTDRNIEKKALRNMYADRMDEAALIVRDNAESSKDWDVYGSLTEKAYKMRGLDKEDPKKMDKEAYLKPIRYYSLDSTVVGLPEINRQELARQIEALEIPEREKSRLRMEAKMEQIKIEDRLNELQKEAQGGE
ncbi:hypothetical protein GCM10027284_08880 [Cyclobacterium sediminis]